MVAVADRITVDLGGLIAEGDDWVIDIGGLIFTTYTVVAGDDLNDVAAGLAGLIDAHGDLLAVARGGSLLIVDESGPVAGVILTPPTDSTVVLGELPTALVLEGAVIVGEVWTLVTDSETFTYTVMVDNRLVDVAAGLAEDINTDSADANLFAVAEGASLVIDALDSAAIGIGELRLIVPSGSTLMLGPDPAAVTIVELSGTAVTGDRWQIDDLVYVVRGGDDLIDVARRLAEEAVLAEKPYTVAVLGTTLVFVHPDDIAFTASPVFAHGTITLSEQAEFESAVALLAGDVAEDEIWKVTIGAVEATYTAVAGDTTADVAEGLAQDITDNLTDYVAFTNDRTLIIVRVVGSGPFTPTYSIAPMAGESAVSDPRITPAAGGAIVKRAALPPSPITEQNVNVVLITGASATQHGYRVQTGDTTAIVGQGIVADINVNADEAFFASLIDGVGPDSDGLYIINLEQLDFELANPEPDSDAASTVVVALQANHVFAGEVWTLIIDDGTFTTVHAHVVVEGETPEDVARELANNVLLSSAVGFTGIADGQQIIIVNLTNVSFTVAVEVSPVGQISIIEAREPSEPEAGNEYFFRPVNLNTRVEEADQVDTLNVYNNNSPENEGGELTDRALTGLGMGGNTIIAGRELPGGIEYRELEVLNVGLGTGVDDFTITSTHGVATNIDFGRDDDIVHVVAITGHTTLLGNAGNDDILVSSDAASSLVDPVLGLLTVDGGAGSDDLTIDDSGEVIANVGLLTGTTLTGLDLPSVAEVQRIVVQAAGGTYTLRIADDRIDSAAVTTTVIELAGTPVDGDQWSVTIN